MKSVNALQVRQALGRILDELDAGDEPMLVVKGHQARAVLLPLRLFRERFADKTVHEERLAIEERIADLRKRLRTRKGRSAEQTVRELRGSLS